MTSIKSIKTTPLLVRDKVPYVWAQGVTYGAEVILIEIQTTDGVSGYGESIGAPLAAAVNPLIDMAAQQLIGESVFDNRRLMAQCAQSIFQLHGIGRASGLGQQVLAGLEMAMWDAAGKTAGYAVHELLGGKVREEIEYFGFIQGDTAEELASHAADLVKEGHHVIYGKVGRGEQQDFEIVRQVRAADQSVFDAADVYNAVRMGAADLIVLGLHETGGVVPFIEAAAVAAAAGINICLHGVHETGITTCASNHAAAVITNLDDGNQYMNHLLASDIISSPQLSLVDGRLPVLAGPGFGFEIDTDAVAKAAEEYQASL